MATTDSRRSEIVCCPGCGGRGFTVSLDSMIPCGRCHGDGKVDLAREEADRQAEDARLKREFDRHMAELDRLIGEVDPPERLSRLATRALRALPDPAEPLKHGVRATADKRYWLRQLEGLGYAENRVGWWRKTRAGVLYLREADRTKPQ